MFKFKVFSNRRVSIILFLAFFTNLFMDFSSLSASQKMIGFNNFGKIVESFDGNSFGKVVIIKDLHLNREVEENIYKILESLKAENGKNFKKVFLEGLEDKELNLDILKVLPKDKREKYIDIFMEKGLVQGGEKFKIYNDGMKVLGAEEYGLYLENFRKFYKSFKYLEDLEEEFLLLGRGFRRNRRYFLNSLTANFLFDKEKFRSEDLGKYLRYLKGLCSQISRSMENIKKEEAKREDKRGIFKKYDELNKVIEVLDRKEGLDASIVEFEAGEVIKRIEKFLEGREIERLGRGEKYYEELSKILYEKNIDISKNYRYLKEYLEILEEIRGLDEERILLELEGLEEEIILKLNKGLDAKEFFINEKRMKDLKRYLSNELSYYEVGRFDASFNNWFYNFREFSRRIFREDYLLGKEEILKEAYRNIRGFYDLAEKRNEVMAGNVLGSKLEKGEVRALVVGGYHAEGIKELFRTRGVSFVEIIPNVKGEDALGLYEKRVKLEGERFGLDKETKDLEKTGKKIRQSGNFKNKDFKKDEERINDKLQVLSVFSSKGLDLSGTKIETFVEFLVNKENFEEKNDKKGSKNLKSKAEILEEKYNRLDDDLKYMISILAYYSGNKNIDIKSLEKKNNVKLTKEEEILKEAVEKLEEKGKNLGLEINLEEMKKILVEEGKKEELKRIAKKIEDEENRKGEKNNKKLKIRDRLKRFNQEVLSLDKVIKKVYPTFFLKKYLVFYYFFKKAKEKDIPQEEIFFSYSFEDKKDKKLIKNMSNFENIYKFDYTNFIKYIVSYIIDKNIIIDKENNKHNLYLLNNVHEFIKNKENEKKSNIDDISFLDGGQSYTILFIRKAIDYILGKEKIEDYNFFYNNNKLDEKTKIEWNYFLNLCNNFDNKIKEDKKDFYSLTCIENREDFLKSLGITSSIYNIFKKEGIPIILLFSLNSLIDKNKKDGHEVCLIIDTSKEFDDFINNIVKYSVVNNRIVSDEKNRIKDMYIWDSSLASESYENFQTFIDNLNINIINNETYQHHGLCYMWAQLMMYCLIEYSIEQKKNGEKNENIFGKIIEFLKKGNLEEDTLGFDIYYEMIKMTEFLLWYIGNNNKNAENIKEKIEEIYSGDSYLFDFYKEIFESNLKNLICFKYSEKFKIIKYLFQGHYLSNFFYNFMEIKKNEKEPLENKSVNNLFYLIGVTLRFYHFFRDKKSFNNIKNIYFSCKKGCKNIKDLINKTSKKITESKLENFEEKDFSFDKEKFNNNLHPLIDEDSFYLSISRHTRYIRNKRNWKEDLLIRFNMKINREEDFDYFRLNELMIDFANFINNEKYKIILDKILKGDFIQEDFTSDIINDFLNYYPNFNENIDFYFEKINKAFPNFYDYVSEKDKKNKNILYYLSCLYFYHNYLKEQQNKQENNKEIFNINKFNLKLKFFFDLIPQIKEIVLLFTSFDKLAYRAYTIGENIQKYENDKNRKNIVSLLYYYDKDIDWFSSPAAFTGTFTDDLFKEDVKDENNLSHENKTIFSNLKDKIKKSKTKMKKVLNIGKEKLVKFFGKLNFSKNKNEKSQEKIIEKLENLLGEGIGKISLESGDIDIALFESSELQSKFEKKGENYKINYRMTEGFLKVLGKLEKILDKKSFERLLNGIALHEKLENLYKIAFLKYYEDNNNLETLKDDAHKFALEFAGEEQKIISRNFEKIEKLIKLEEKLEKENNLDEGKKVSEKVLNKEEREEVINIISELNMELNLGVDGLDIEKKRSRKNIKNIYETFPRLKKEVERYISENVLESEREIVIDISGKSFIEIKDSLVKLDIKNKYGLRVILLGEAISFDENQALNEYLLKNFRSSLCDLTWVLGKGLINDKNFKKDEKLHRVVEVLGNGYILSANGSVTEEVYEEILNILKEKGKILGKDTKVPNRVIADILNLGFLGEKEYEKVYKSFMKGDVKDIKKDINQIILGMGREIGIIEEEFINRVGDGKVKVIEKEENGLVLLKEVEKINFSEGKIDLDTVLDLKVAKEEKLELEGLDEKAMRLKKVGVFLKSKINKIMINLGLKDNDAKLKMNENVRLFASAA